VHEVGNLKQIYSMMHGQKKKFRLSFLKNWRINPLNPSGFLRTTRFKIKDSTFYPHSAFKCFVLISEQTAIISLYNINW